MTHLTFVLIIFTLIQLLDCGTTYYLIKKKWGKEANPLIVKLMEKIGIIPGLIISRIIYIGILFVIWYPNRTIGALIWLLYIYCVFIGVLLAKFNISILLEKLKHHKE